MEIIKLENDIQIFYVTAKSYPEGILAELIRNEIKLL
jgi:hypothetical protein